MHLSPRAQEQAHAAIVRAAIAHALPGVTLPEIVSHAAPATLAYRTRARLYVKADRRGTRVGYRAAASHDIAAVDRCLVLDPSIAPLFGGLAEVLADARGEGDAAVARGKGGFPVVSLGWRGELPASTWAALDERVSSGAWAGARVVLVDAARPAVFGDPRAVIIGVAWTSSAASSRRAQPGRGTSSSSSQAAGRSRCSWPVTRPASPRWRSIPTRATPRVAT
jgi:23S rRNA (uracil1939-C5)-methyltransferase